MVERRLDRAPAYMATGDQRLQSWRAVRIPSVAQCATLSRDRVAAQGQCADVCRLEPITVACDCNEGAGALTCADHLRRHPQQLTQQPALRQTLGSWPTRARSHANQTERRRGWAPLTGVANRDKQSRLRARRDARRCRATVLQRKSNVLAATATCQSTSSAMATKEHSL